MFLMRALNNFNHSDVLLLLIYVTTVHISELPLKQDRLDIYLEIQNLFRTSFKM